MKKKLVLLLTCLFVGIGLVTAQNQKVTGVVLSEEDGQPIIGASVLVKGTTLGTSTDIDGKFTLSNIPGSAKVLVVSYIGMKTSEVAIKANLKIMLKPDAQVVDEVVVVAYGTAKKSSFTGSAKSVSSDQIVSGNRESIDKAIAGKISGVRVSSSTGDPGAAGEVNIRGVGSISASTTPLYVIDGVPVQVNNDMSFGEKSSSTLSTLNPEDVESMTILKDAAAASLYGSRAANGVVIITTKKGKSGATKVTYSGELGFSSMAVKQYEMATGPQYIQYVTDGALNDYILNKDAYIADYPNMAGATDQQWKDFAKTNLVPGDVASLAADPTGATSTDWRKEIYRTSMSQDHQVSLSGGNDKTRFYSGIGYNKADGIVLGSSFDRISGRLNVDHKINKFVDVSLKQMVSVTSQDGFRDQGDQAQGIGTSSPLGILFAMDPTATVKNADGTYNADAGMGLVSNPHIMLAGESSAREFVNSKTKRSLSNGDLSVKILPELVFKTVFGYDYTNVQHQEYWSPTSVNGTSLQGLGQRDNYENQIVTSSSTLRYSKSFNKVHNLDALVAFESESSKILWLSASAKGYTTDKLPELSAGQTYQNGSAIYEASMLSYLGNVNYNYNSKYYVSGSFRRDGSSRLGLNNRWGDFWSASVAWRLSQEDFLKDNPLFSDLKLRASYGTNGTLPSDYYASQRLYSYNGGYGNDGAIYWSNPGNVDLGWEKSNNFNIGFDWNIYNRVNLTLEYYNKVTTDLLFQVPSSVVTGFSETWQNLGKMTNDGIELEVSSVNVKNKNFSWNTSLNFTYQKNKINELPDGKDISFGDGGMYILKEGESIHSFYLPTWMGVNKQTGLGEFLIDPNGDKTAAANRTNTYSKAGKSVVGKAMPDVLGGLTNSFSYKGFDLSFLITYQFGGNLFDYPGYFAQSDGVRIGKFNTTKDYVENYWREPGDNAKYPKPIWGNPYRSDKWSSRHILSTDHIRLKDITFGYTVPKFNKNISRLRVYFKANNLALLWAKTKGIEPEVALNGYRQVDTPATRNCAVGVNLEF